jgi:hypothetical protein
MESCDLFIRTHVDSDNGTATAAAALRSCGRTHPLSASRVSVSEPQFTENHQSYLILSNE